MSVVLPFRGEFGLKLRYHVPAVHALGSVVVCAEPGEEALYPRATEVVSVAANGDDRRRDSYAKDRAFVEATRAAMQARYPGAEMLETTRAMPQTRFVPEPTVRYGLTADVVVSPRRRKYGSEKNWPHWAWLVERLAKQARVVAGGSPDASEPVPCPAAWEHPRCLDATIEAMLSARLVISTDAGLAHLAVLCGRPLLLISHDKGLVAPGPVRDEAGRAMRPRYWPIRLAEYYEAANHCRAPIAVVHHGWQHPERVLNRALELVKR